MRQENASWSVMESLKKHISQEDRSIELEWCLEKNSITQIALQFTEYNLDFGYSYHNYVIRKSVDYSIPFQFTTIA